MYGIVRCMGKKEKQYQSIAETLGWTVQYYNLEKKDVNIGLSNAPTTNTIIFIKGALRMGKQICKTHVGFVFETTETPNTDTVLQGLLGRMCSFTNVSHVRIYLHQDIVDSKELEKYISFIDEIAANHLPKILPTKAMNIKMGEKTTHQTKNNTYSCCPLFLPAKYITVTANTPLNACISSIFNDLSQYPEVMNKNGEEYQEEIREMLIDNETTFSTHKLSKISNYKKIHKLITALEEGREFHSCSDSNVHLWLVDVSLPEYPQLTVNDVYIELKTKNNTIVTNDATHPLNVQTTMKEVFY